MGKVRKRSAKIEIKAIQKKCTVYTHAEIENSCQPKDFKNIKIKKKKFKFFNKKLGQFKNRSEFLEILILFGHYYMKTTCIIYFGI